MKNLDETPPEGIKVGVNDDDFSIIYADIEGPGMLCFTPTLPDPLRYQVFGLEQISTLQLELPMRMVFSA